MLERRMLSASFPFSLLAAKSMYLIVNDPTARKNDLDSPMISLREKNTFEVYFPVRVLE